MPGAVVVSRAATIALGTAVALTVAYTCITDGSPFRKELLIPWMRATLVDFYVLVALLSAWVAYKENSWIRCLAWILLFCCFGSIAASFYVAIQLFKISADEPLYMVLFRDCHTHSLLPGNGDPLNKQKLTHQ